MNRAQRHAAFACFRASATSFFFSACHPSTRCLSNSFSRRFFATSFRCFCVNNDRYVSRLFANSGSNASHSDTVFELPCSRYDPRQRWRMWGSAFALKRRRSQYS